MRKWTILFSLLTFYSISCFSQSEITGKITDSKDGSPLAGVTIRVKGGTATTQSEANGIYRISLPAKAVSLVFSYVGFASEEINVGNKTTISIAMTTEERKLQEVTVVAYGAQSKKEITGSVVKVDNKQLEDIPLVSVDQMLQGKVAGLQSISTSGQPGAAQDIVIRGIGSISANSAPLFVIDGIPANTGDFSSTTQTSNALAGLNPNDIESISVLKDAASASVYGSRAANGVIVITTKKGRIGKTQFKVDLETGTNSRSYAPSAGKPLNREQYLGMTTEGLSNAGFSQSDAAQILDELGANSSVNTDWLKTVQRKGLQQSVNISASGGDNKTQFYVSGGYFNQQASVIASSFKRYSGTVNLQHNVDDKLSLNLSLNLSQSMQLTPTVGGAYRNPIWEASFLLPTQAPVDHDTIVYDRNQYDLLNGLYNPLAIAKYDRNTLSNFKGIGSIGAEYKILPDLKFASKYGIDYLTLEELQYYNPFFGDAYARGGDLESIYTRIFNWVWTNTLAYRKYFNHSQNIYADVKIGYEAQRSQEFAITADGTGVPLTTQLPLPAIASPTAAAEAQSNYSFASAFAIASVNYKNRYVLSGSVRRDGSSRFGIDNRYGTFWSVGGAWNLDQEDFLFNSPIISALKLRSSYGVNGNASIGNYQAVATYTFGNGNNYVQQPGSYPENVGNRNLTWELNKPFNIGMDAGLFKNRVTFSVEYYNRVTSHLLLGVPLSRTTGFTSSEQNVGAMKNTGVEITFNATPVKQKFRWDIGFNIAFNKNKVTELYNGQDIFDNVPYLVRVGYDVQTLNTRLWAGADPQTGAPLWYTDATKKATTSDISQVQRAIVGSADPKGLGGFNNTFSYMGFSLDAQFSFQYGNLLYDAPGTVTNSDGSNPAYNTDQKELRRWQKPGDKTDVPQYVFGNASNSSFGSTRYVYNGSFIRLRNVTLGYQPPKAWLTKFHLTNLMIYARGTNFWTKTFDKNLPYDPENGTPGLATTPIQGQNNLQIFVQKSFSIGLNIGL